MSIKKNQQRVLHCFQTYLITGNVTALNQYQQAWGTVEISITKLDGLRSTLSQSQQILLDRFTKS